MNRLRDYASASLDPVWPMPALAQPTTPAELTDADIEKLAGHSAGAVTAALFLNGLRGDLGCIF